jgi:ATP-dependent DNA helicase RecG
MTAPIKDEKVIAGTVGQVFARLADILKAHIFVSVEIATPVEVRRYDYPFQAIWQLACNAVMHRSYQGTNAPVRITWYSDRIEISNPGGPFGRLNKDNFGKPGFTDYRNPNLAEAMKYLGLVQRFGIGIMIAQSELERNGNPPAEFDVGESWITATVRRA